jgi:magnesium transporter
MDEPTGMLTSRPSRSDGPPEDDGPDGLAVVIRRHRPGGSDRPDGPTRFRVGCWDGAAYSGWEGVDGLAEKLALPGVALWIDVAGPTPEQLATVTEALKLHPLVAEDILEGNQRSKIEVTDELIHIVLFVLGYVDGSVEATEVDIVLGEGFLLTVHDPSWDPWTTRHIRDGAEAVLRRGTDHMLWALVDTIVDDYFPFIDRVGDEIDDLQDRVIDHATPATLQSLFALKRELIQVRRAVAPIREIFNQLTNRELELIDADEILYFRDVYDHLIRLTDEVDNYRELVSGTLDVYLSTVNNNLSLIMKRLTGITVILAGIGAIGGLFGMSEAGNALAGTEARGFWLVVAFTVGLAFAIAWWLHRIDWI